jgi:hypothetical protein
MWAPDSASVVIGDGCLYLDLADGGACSQLGLPRARLPAHEDVTRLLTTFSAEESARFLLLRQTSIDQMLGGPCVPTTTAPALPAFLAANVSSAYLSPYRALLSEDDVDSLIASPADRVPTYHEPLPLTPAAAMSRAASMTPSPSAETHRYAYPPASPQTPLPADDSRSLAPPLRPRAQPQAARKARVPLSPLSPSPPSPSRPGARRIGRQQNPADREWSMEQLGLSTRELNVYIRESQLPADAVARLKAARRRLKNRSYAHRSRLNRRGGATGADEDDGGEDEDEEEEEDEEEDYDGNAASPSSSRRRTARA